MNIADWLGVFVIVYAFFAVYFLAERGELVKLGRGDDRNPGSNELMEWIVWESRHTDRFFIFYAIGLMFLCTVFIVYPFGWILPMGLYVVFLYRFYMWYRIEKQEIE